MRACWPPRPVQLVCSFWCWRALRGRHAESRVPSPERPPSPPRVRAAVRGPACSKPRSSPCPVAVQRSDLPSESSRRVTFCYGLGVQGVLFLFSESSHLGPCWALGRGCRTGRPGLRPDQGGRAQRLRDACSGHGAGRAHGAQVSRSSPHPSSWPWGLGRAPRPSEPVSSFGISRSFGAL